MNDKVLKTLEFDKITESLARLAASEPGKKKCLALIPSSDPREIAKSQDETADAAERVRMKGSLSFSGLRDVTDSVKRLEIGGDLTARELLAISELLTCAARARSYGKSDTASETAGPLDPMFSALDPLTGVNNEIRRCVISEDEIADDASAALRDVRRKIRAASDRVHTQLNSILNSNRAILMDPVITMRDGRYCLPVKAEYRSRFEGVVHDQSSTGSTIFMEPMAIVRINNEIRELEIKEKKEIETILAGLSADLAPYTAEIGTDLSILSELDFIFAKAALARQYKCSRPVFNERGYINIKEGRHPLLDMKTVIPINIFLGDKFDQLIVTGPNTGGKTVTLKTVGLFCLMGQAGLQIPAFEGSELCVFDEIFADIGDEQSIEQSLSTFSAHMTNIVSILEKADSRSLCLFDELGAGTDPTEGAALAVAILSFLHNMQCRTIATTHYSELKVFALTTPGVENACCEFDVETLKPTYRLLIGIPGKSNAFAIAGKLGLPDYILDDAKNRVDENDAAFEDVLSGLEESRTAIEKEREEVAESRKEIESLQSDLREKEERLGERRERIINDANEEARKILRDAKETADSAIRNINRVANDTGASKELEAERTRLRESLEKADESLGIKGAGTKSDKPVSAKDLHIGDGVRVLTLNLDGTVSSLPNAKGDLYVQMGILRSQVNIKDIELLDEPTVTVDNVPKKGRSSPGAGDMPKSYSVSPEINLIGMTVDEAIPELDKYLDDAYLAHLDQVRIVHGRGTGALKNAVHKHLRRLKYVKDFRLGEFGEGDTGVTIVTFR